MEQHMSKPQIMEIDKQKHVPTFNCSTMRDLSDCIWNYKCQNWTTVEDLSFIKLRQKSDSEPMTIDNSKQITMSNWNQSMLNYSK